MFPLLSELRVIAFPVLRNNFSTFLRSAWYMGQFSKRRVFLCFKSTDVLRYAFVQLRGKAEGGGAGEQKQKQKYQAKGKNYNAHIVV